MKLTCASCQQQILLDDAKLPQGVFKVKCPKCGKVVTGQKDAAPATAPSAPAPSAASGLSAADELQAAYGATESAPAPTPAEQQSEGEAPPTDPAIQSLIRREVAHVRSEILGSLGALFGGGKLHHRNASEDDEDEGFGKKALVCEDDPAFSDIISAALKRLGYGIDLARTTAESLKSIETGSYDLITVDYNFPDDKDGGTKIMARINGQKPATRRDTFVVLVSASVKSADPSAAFFHGANITVNKDEIRNLEPLIRTGQRKFRDIYRVFNRVLDEKNEKM